MKKLIALVLVIVIGLVSVTLVACDDEPCSHTYGTWSVTEDATCTKQGTKTRKCTKCGNVQTETINALGHNFVNGECTVCGATE